MAATIDYSGICDMINSIVLGAAQDPDIVSSCLQRTRGFSNSVPSDVYAMSSYLPRAFEFMVLSEDLVEFGLNDASEGLVLGKSFEFILSHK